MSCEIPSRTFYNLSIISIVCAVQGLPRMISDADLDRRQSMFSTPAKGKLMKGGYVNKEGVYILSTVSAQTCEGYCKRMTPLLSNLIKAPLQRLQRLN